MNLAQVLAFLGPFLPAVETELMNLDANVIQPWVKAQIAKETSPAIVTFLTALDTALDSAVQAAITKI